MRRVALITGASRGIGAATAMLLALPAGDRARRRYTERAALP